MSANRSGVTRDPVNPNPSRQIRGSPPARITTVSAERKESLRPPTPAAAARAAAQKREYGLLRRDLTRLVRDDGGSDGLEVGEHQVVRVNIRTRNTR